MIVVGADGSRPAGREQDSAMNIQVISRDQVSDYLARIGATPLLTTDEETALAKRMEAGAYAAHLIEQGAADPELAAVAADGRAARKHMIEANLRLVVSIAKRYASRGMSLADVIQDGNLGLIEAVDRFDHARGNRFSTVATWWIRKAIQHGLEHAHAVRLPIGVQDQLIKIARVESEATHRLGRTPTERELAEKTQQKPAKLAVLRRLPWNCLSLDLPAGEGPQRHTIGDLVEDDQCRATDRLVEQKMLKQAIDSLVAGLAPRQALILRLRFGLDGHDRHTPRQIATKLGLTPQWVRCLEKESLARMRGSGSPQRLRAWAS
ncbi:RNA polymerase primary sigma factor/RNA polymerase nonessential primary-like sigma factor [Nonomuraea solani]|uniref:RNA polymerase primary sigma factor/RNA polymerase nonessential primary-like sigma factor n=1 Tax=Nonomuraea solani TaxID=1144553 RepID=A0A1H6F4R1_9ACTN|nr:sigma-70 family RNA polymerase sigma factor [Nonomuraea solani]SEH04015.1 RNA polymerase primary sigma factor/RNA polymerase nonessential primary-like sigma factor [Nonomuraea solani]